MFRFILFLIGAALLLIEQIRAEEAINNKLNNHRMLAVGQADTSKILGLWVEAEGKNRPFDSREGFEKFIANIENSPVTDVFCQVYREGKAWFQTPIADTKPLDKTQEAGIDVLGETIYRLKSKGKRVHAWINVLRVGKNQALPIFRLLGEEVALVDNFGNSLLAYDNEGNAPLVSGKGNGGKLGTPGVWLDPSDGLLRAYLTSLVNDILYRYPDLDGIHLDMIRFPESLGGTTDFGYGKSMLTRYGVSSFEKDIINSLKNDVGYRNWRKEQVTTIVRQINKTIKEKKSSIQLSAAVFASPDRALKEVFQDWPKWLEENLINFALPMAYSKDRNVFNSWINEISELSLNEKILIGLGGWLMLDNPRMLNEQANLVYKKGFRGVTVFSYSNLLSDRGMKMIEGLGNIQNSSE